VTDGPERDAATAAEERLLAHVEGLRDHPPEPTEQLVATIVSAARWQGAVRPYLDAAGALWGAAAIGFRVLADPRGQR
jgi:hypothetical protein